MPPPKPPLKPPTPGRLPDQSELVDAGKPGKPVGVTIAGEPAAHAWNFSPWMAVRRINWRYCSGLIPRVCIAKSFALDSSGGGFDQKGPCIMCGSTPCLASCDTGVRSERAGAASCFTYFCLPPAPTAANCLGAATSKYPGGSCPVAGLAGGSPSRMSDSKPHASRSFNAVEK